MKIDLKRLHEDETYRRKVHQSLMEKYERQIFFFCRTQLGVDYESDVVQDVMQNVWLYVYKGLSRLKHTTYIRAWIYKIALNNCWKQKRSWGIYYRNQRTIQRELYYDPKIDKEYLRENIDNIKKGIDELKESDRTIINMRFIELMPYDMIARILGKTEQAVRKRTEKALKRLKKVINDAI